MIRLTKQKKGDMIGFYWILIMIIVCFFIAVCVLMVNGAPIDTRGVESDILFNRVVDCVMERVYLISELSLQATADSFDVEKECRFNFNEFNSQTNSIDKGQYYVEISVQDLDKKNLINYKTKDGNVIATYCDKQIQGDKEVEKWPRCATREIYGLMKTDSGDKEIVLIVKAGVNKGGKNVK